MEIVEPLFAIQSLPVCHCVEQIIITSYVTGSAHMCLLFNMLLHAFY